MLLLLLLLLLLHPANCVASVHFQDSLDFKVLYGPSTWGPPATAVTRCTTRSSTSTSTHELHTSNEAPCINDEAPVSTIKSSIGEEKEKETQQDAGLSPIAPCSNHYTPTALAPDSYMADLQAMVSTLHHQMTSNSTCALPQSEGTAGGFIPNPTPASSSAVPASAFMPTGNQDSGSLNPHTDSELARSEDQPAVETEVESSSPINPTVLRVSRSHCSIA